MGTSPAGQARGFRWKLEIASAAAISPTAAQIIRAFRDDGNRKGRAKDIERVSEQLVDRSIGEAHARVTRCDHQECAALAARRFVDIHIDDLTAGAHYAQLEVL